LHELKAEGISFSLCLFRVGGVVLARTGGDVFPVRSGTGFSGEEARCFTPAVERAGPT